ncbi:MAG: outer rane beta-barrel protein [Xanthobacteraceae bacterium]|jgi:hypothetical protein|nr:outer rane beta-barrel protein [Xanthobacteraceae bacterium]
MPRRQGATYVATPLAALLLAICANSAHAGSTSIGGSVTFERMPDDFDASKSTDWELDASHTFDNHFIIGAAVKYYDTSSSPDHNTNVQGSIGYTHDFGTFALTGSTGIGQHFISSDDSTSFTYYFFTIAADIPISSTIVWNAVSLRYRNAFDTANDYNTPEVATGVTLRLDEHNSVSLRLERDWKDEVPSYTAVELGYKYRF